MGCASCATSSEIAFALTVYVEGQDRTVEVEFCSIECLRQWTCDGCTSISEWTWGVTGTGEDPPSGNQPADEGRRSTEKRHEDEGQRSTEKRHEDEGQRSTEKPHEEEVRQSTEEPATHSESESTLARTY